MPVDIRPVEGGEIAEFERIIELAFGEIPGPDFVSTWTPLLEPGRNLAAFDDPNIVGGAAVVTLGITVPGAVAPAGAVVATGILPTHRRQGLLGR